MKDFVGVLLGDEYDNIIGPYNGYNSNINPNIPTEFSTACYRLGHSLLINSIPTIDRFGRIRQ
jgi:peroxidase